MQSQQNRESSSLSLKDALFGSATDHPQHQILILDGGVSTHLEDLRKGEGFPYRELWSSGLLLSDEGRELILKGHKDWLHAGVNILSTVTYQCHYESNLWPKQRGNVLSLIKSNADMDKMWKYGIELARQAVVDETTTTGAAAATNNNIPGGRAYYVVASSGCYGAALANGAEYTGDYGSAVSCSDLCDFHWKKWHRAAELKPDGIAIETIPSLAECYALVQLFQRVESSTEAAAKHNDIACWISLACQNGTQLNDGNPVEKALEVLLGSIPIDRLQGIGFNCCDCSHLHSLVKILVHYLIHVEKQRRAILIYPNSGEDWDATTETWKVGTGCTSPQDMANNIYSVIETIENEWKQSTTTLPIPTLVVGGCCRTRPGTIASLQKLVVNHLSTSDS